MERITLSSVIGKYKDRAVIVAPDVIDDDILMVYSLMIGIDAAIIRDPEFFNFDKNVYPKDDELWLIIDYLTCPIGRPKYRKWRQWIMDNFPDRNLTKEKLDEWILLHRSA